MNHDRDLTSLKVFLYRKYYKVINSIALIPSILSIAFLALAFSMLYFEQLGYFNQLKENFLWINIKSANNARAVVSTILAGLISLTVFSFSMVMNILSQAYSSFTPKVIGGLISNKSNQTILGVYIGSIIYCLIVLISFRDNDNYSVLPSLAILISAFLGLISLALFVKFLNDISDQIQIKNIIKRIHHSTLCKLKLLKEESKTQIIPEVKTWFTYFSRETGYIQSINEKEILNLADKHNIILKVDIVMGEYITEKQQLFSINKLVDEIILADIFNNFNFFSEEKIEINDFFGFRQLTEIASKALSPGINDSGTAVMCIDFITSLLAFKINIEDKRIVSNINEKTGVIYSTREFSEYLDICFMPIFLYGKEDVILMIKILRSLQILAYFDSNNLHQKLFIDFAQYIINGSNESIKPEYERSKIKVVIDDLRKSDYFHALKDLGHIQSII